MKRLFIMCSLAAAMLLAFSCGRGIDLAGEWNVVSVNGEALSDTLETAPFLAFDVNESRLHGNTGVNILNGTYTLKGDKIAFGSMGMTMMAGPEPLMELEGKILEAIEATASVEKVSADAVNLLDSDGKTALELRRK